MPIGKQIRGKGVDNPGAITGQRGTSGDSDIENNGSGRLGPTGQTFLFGIAIYANIGISLPYKSRRKVGQNLVCAQVGKSLNILAVSLREGFI